MSKIEVRRAHRSSARRLGKFIAISAVVVLSVTAPGADSSSTGVAQTAPNDIAGVLGIPRAPKAGQAATPVNPNLPLNPGLPLNMVANAALSTAVMTTVSGHGVSVMGDWDGMEDLIADHAGRIANILSPGVVITRTAISEHTMANGFNEDIFYYGDSEGNLYVASTNTFPSFGGPPAPNLTTINLPTV
jgi:hypothetical protein